MRLVPTLESQARPAVRPSAAPRVTHAHQDFLPFLHVAAHDLREVPIADAGLHRDGDGLALRPVHEEAARERALARELRLGQLGVVLGALARGEDGADLVTRRLADALTLHATLAVAASGERAHLLPGLLEDRDELLLLLGTEAKRLGQSVAHLLRGLRCSARGQARPAAAPDGHAILARHTEAQGRVRNLESAFFLRDHQA